MPWEDLKNWRGLIGYLADRREARGGGGRPTISAPGLHPALPAGLQITVGEQQDVGADVIEFRVEDDANASRRCLLTMAGGDGDTRGAVVRHGDPVRIVMNPQGAVLFSGSVYGLGVARGGEQPARRTVTGYDRLIELTMSRRLRGFEDYSRRDVLRDVAMAHALSSDVWDDGVYRPQWVQANETDYSFALRLVREADCEMWVEDDEFHVAPVGGRSEDVISLSADSDFEQLSVTTDLTGQRVSIDAGGWDPSVPAAVSGTGSASTFAGSGSGGRIGAGILEELDLNDARDRIAGAGFLAPDADGAAGSARAAFAATAREFVTLTATVPGNARLQVGATIDLTGLDAGFDGRYRVVSTEHIYHRERGYTVRFAATRPDFGRGETP